VIRRMFFTRPPTVDGRPRSLVGGLWSNGC